MQDNKFWLIFWAMAFTTVISVVSVLAFTLNLNSSRMAQLGYMEKIVIIPETPYTRRDHEKVWVPKDREPIVEISQPQK